MLSFTGLGGIQLLPAARSSMESNAGNIRLAQKRRVKYSDFYAFKLPGCPGVGWMVVCLGEPILASRGTLERMKPLWEV